MPITTREDAFLHGQQVLRTGHVLTRKPGDEIYSCRCTEVHLISSFGEIAGEVTSPRRMVALCLHHKITKCGEAIGGCLLGSSVYIARYTEYNAQYNSFDSWMNPVWNYKIHRAATFSQRTT